MSERLLFWYRLKPGVERERYERWVHDRDAPAARSRPTVIRYETIRVEGVIDGEASAPDYVDVLEVSSITADQEAAGGPDGDALAREWLAMVSDYVILRGTAIASHPTSDEERR